MKHKIWTMMVIVILLAFSINACGSENAPQDTPEVETITPGG